MPDRIVQEGEEFSRGSIAFNAWHSVFSTYLIPSFSALGQLYQIEEPRQANKALRRLFLVLQ
jgi:hypothetical protein